MTCQPGNDRGSFEEVDQFIGQVQHRARLGSRGDAERATRARLETLAERMADGAAHNLAAQRPSEIGEHLRRNAPDQSGTGEPFSLDEFFERVTEPEGVDQPDAVFHARKTVHEIWPNAGIPGQLAQDLPTWSHFEEAAELVSEDDATASVPCGPDVGPVVESVRRFLDAGYDHLYFHQIGSDQDGFFRFWNDELQPALADVTTDAPASRHKETS